MLWPYFLLLVLGAALSQVAEWAHLSFRERPWWQAYLGALSVVLAEYACSVTANRALYPAYSAFLLQVVWNCAQQAGVNVYLYWGLHQTYNAWHVAAVVFLLGAFVCAARGESRQV